jgi:hypothetical protein
VLIVQADLDTSPLNHLFRLAHPGSVSRYMYDFLNKFAYHTTVKHCKTAVCGHQRTIVSLDFGSTARLQYSKHPYSAIYGTVESPNCDYLGICKGLVYPI